MTTAYGAALDFFYVNRYKASGVRVALDILGAIYANQSAR
jgi:molybdate-binding protein